MYVNIYSYVLVLLHPDRNAVLKAVHLLHEIVLCTPRARVSLYNSGTISVYDVIGS